MCSVSFREAVELGIDNIEHGLLTNSDYDETREPDACSPNLMSSVADLEMDSDEVQATFRAMNEAGVAMTATPVVFEMFVQGRTTMDERTRLALAPEVVAEVERAAARIDHGDLTALLYLQGYHARDIRGA